MIPFEQQINLLLPKEDQEAIHGDEDLQKLYPLCMKLIYLSEVSGVYTREIVQVLLRLSKRIYVEVAAEAITNRHKILFTDKMTGFFMDNLDNNPEIIPDFVGSIQQLPPESRFTFLKHGFATGRGILIKGFFAWEPYKKFLDLTCDLSLERLMSILPFHSESYLYFLLKSPEGQTFLQPWSSSYEELENHYNSIEESAPEFHLITSLCIKSIICRLNKLFTMPPPGDALSKEAAEEIEAVLTQLYAYIKSHTGLPSAFIDSYEISYELGMLLEQGSTEEAYSRVLHKWYSRNNFVVFETLKRHAPLAIIEGLAHFYKIYPIIGASSLPQSLEIAITIALGYAEKTAKLKAYEALFNQKNEQAERTFVSTVSPGTFFATKRKFNECISANDEIEDSNKVNKTDKSASVPSSNLVASS